MGELDPQADGVVEQQGESTDGNPAWNNFLEVLPQEYHEKVTPLLQEWDKNVQNLVQKVHSDYEPWKPVVDSGTDPETAKFALQLLNGINENPRMVFDALGEYHNFFDAGDEGEYEQGQEEPGSEDYYDPRVDELQQHIQTLASVILEKNQKEQEANEDAELDQQLTSLKQQYGDYDEDYVLAKMMNGMEAENAVKSYFEKVEQLAQRRIPKPLIMGGGGGLPNQTPNVTQMDDKGVKNLVAQMLQNAADQRR
jgi:hypothetical protein